MIRFNLTLSDYLEQYISDKQQHLTNCPICYQDELSGDRARDIPHIISCYKHQTLLEVMKKYYDKFEEYPELTDEFIGLVDVKVELEMLDYCELFLDESDHP